jgi:large repetitive protein
LVVRRAFLAAAALVALALSPLGVATSAAQALTANADLAISNTASVRHAKAGQELTFTILARNNGPDAVTELDVHVDQVLDGLEIVDVICDRGVTPDPVFCEYSGPIQPGETLATLVVAKVVKTGSKHASDTACVSDFSGEPFVDPNPANDCATATLRIVGKRGQRLGTDQAIILVWPEIMDLIFTA